MPVNADKSHSFCVYMMQPGMQLLSRPPESYKALIGHLIGMLGYVSITRSNAGLRSQYPISIDISHIRDFGFGVYGLWVVYSSPVYNLSSAASTRVYRILNNIQHKL